MHAAHDTVDTICKVIKVFKARTSLKGYFSLSQLRVSMFDKLLELRSNEVSPYIANVEGSEDLGFTMSQ